MPKSEKGNNSVKYSVKYSQNFMEVNQVIYIMHPNCIPDIMILAQAVLQIFCSQGCFTIQKASQKREIIQSNIYRILPKINQVIYTLDTICEPNIMVLA